MVVRWDHTGTYPDLIWDDDAEVMYAFSATTEDIQEGYPFEVFMTSILSLNKILSYFDCHKHW